MKKEITIGVTGLNAIDSPGPGIAVIRGLKESNLFNARIIGLTYENMEPGIYMPGLADKIYMIPFPSEGQEALLQRLEYIHSKEKLDVIIPNFDAELPGFIKLQPILRSMGIQSLLPGIRQFDERHKGNLNKYGKKYDIDVPDSYVTANVEDFRKKLKGLDYPVMIKGKFYEAYKAYSQEQAMAYYYKIVAKWGNPVIIQQFIKGSEFNVTALGDGKGRLIGAVPSRKTYITETGKGWAGISIDDKSLVEMAEMIMEETSWAGGMELELIREDATGKVYLIEINPRFPAWIYLAVGCGQNHPEALVRIAMGEEVDPFTEYDVGKMFIRYSWDMICNLDDFAAISTKGEL